MLNEMSFAGFPRLDNSVGVRNYFLVLSLTGLTGSAARRIGQVLQEAKIVALPYGIGIVGDDALLRERLLLGFACHPNVGAVLLLGAMPPEVEVFAARIERTGKATFGEILGEGEEVQSRLGTSL